MPDPSPVGFVGLGAMGGRMARRIVDAGIPLTTWTRSGTTVPGASAAANPAALAAEHRFVAGCLLGDDAVESVYLGRDGLLAGAVPGTVLVEHGTFSPALARRVGALAAERGVVFIDAPVTGGPEGAVSGSLVAMAGADAAFVASHAEVFGAYLARVVGLGPLGAGLELKMVNQYLVSTTIAAVAEAAALLRASGIDPDRALEVLGSGWAASTMLDRELPRALRDDFASAGATIGGLIHVQALIAESFEAAGILSRLLPAVRGLFADALSAGLADADPAALVAVYRPSS